MLPNWLYGKSKSKLASILGAGGGTPADYDEVKAQVTQNTEDILSLSDALDTKAALTQITNPNLLDNPWFTVNQRGANSYTGSTAKVYSFDRWHIASYASDITVTDNNDGTITIANTGSSDNLQFTQLLESDSLISGKKYTLTCDVIAYTGTVIMLLAGSVSPYPSIINKLIDKTGYVSASGAYDGTSNTYKVSFALYANSSITIRAAKLELGEVSTLAMDTAPDMATELLKCQRYFEKIVVFEHNILDVQASYDRDYYITPKRTNGTLTPYSVNDTAGKISFYINNQWEDGDYSALAWDSPLNNAIRFGAQVPAGSFFKGTIVIDAEL